MNKTRIDWADSTWNPVTGCEHGCEYCYAKRIAERFRGWLPDENPDDYKCVLSKTMLNAVLELDGIQAKKRKDGKIVPAPYPLGFAPTFHRYRLGDPALWKTPRNIFVCSMADLFGDWVPDEWILEVFAACEAAPQHRYLFLTKNPKRYRELYDRKLLPYSDKFWFGSTLTTSDDTFTWFEDTPYHGFVSIEPILEPFGVGIMGKWPEWTIIGAETGKRKGKIAPEKWWIDEIAATCSDGGVAIFMKESLRNLMGDDFRQEFPWEART